MAQGLQVFDENGNSVLNTNNRTLKALGSVYLSINTENKKTVITGLLEQGDSFWYMILDKLKPEYDITCVLEFKPNNIGIMQANITVTANTPIKAGGDSVFVLYGSY